MQGNVIGATPDGLACLGTGGEGVEMRGRDNVVGGTTAAARNVISGNGVTGVLIRGMGSQVKGNYIGVGSDGLTPTHQIRRADRPAGEPYDPPSVIGGTEPGAGNVISGNGQSGVQTTQVLPTTRVMGNFIGTDATGTQAVPNALHGVEVQKQNTHIGGSEPGAGNVISGNGWFGVLVNEASQPTINVSIEGNKIGTDHTGTSAVPNRVGMELGDQRPTVSSVAPKA